MAQAAQGGRLDLMILELLPNPEHSMISVSNMDSLMKKTLLVSKTSWARVNLPLQPFLWKTPHTFKRLNPPLMNKVPLEWHQNGVFPGFQREWDLSYLSSGAILLIASKVILWKKKIIPHFHINFLHYLRFILANFHVLLSHLSWLQSSITLI